MTDKKNTNPYDVIIDTIDGMIREIGQYANGINEQFLSRLTDIHNMHKVGSDIIFDAKFVESEDVVYNVTVIATEYGLIVVDADDFARLNMKKADLYAMDYKELHDFCWNMHKYYDKLGKQEDKLV